MDLRQFLVILLVVLSLATCTAPATPPTVTSSPTSTESPLPTSTPVLEPAPACTPIPTATPTPVPTPTPTSPPPPSFGRYSVNVATFLAPDGRSTASVLTAFPRVGGEEEYYVRLEVKGPSSSHVVIDKWSRWGLGYSVPAILGWSLDSDRVYIATEVVPDGCSPFRLLSDLRAVNVPYGSPKPVEIKLTGPLSLSPDASRIASVVEDSLAIEQLTDGSLTEVELELAESDRAGAIVWSADGSALAFTVQRNACGKGEVESVINVSRLPSLQPRVAISLSGRRVWTNEWIGNRLLLLMGQGNQLLLLDTETGQLFED